MDQGCEVVQLGLYQHLATGPRHSTCTEHHLAMCFPRDDHI